MKEKGPNLSYAGSKYKEEWLKKWLAKPENIRYSKYNILSLKPDKHVGISEKEADEVAKYLSALKDAKVVSGAVSSEELKGGERLKGDWVYSYLKDPDHFDPKGRSPVFALSDGDAKKIAAYVMSFK